MDTLALFPDHREIYERERSAAMTRGEIGRPARLATDLVPRRHVDPDILRAAEDFAEPLIDRFDPWCVLTVEQAALAGRIPVSTAREYIEALKRTRQWTYRSANWRLEMLENGRVGPFVRTRVMR